MNKMADFVPLIKELTACDKEVILPVKGTSMKPCLKTGDLVVYVKPENIKNKDIILYQRNDGSYVLHRIVKVKKDFYVLAGDNQVYKEYPIYKNQIIAKVSAFIINDKRKSLKSLKYRVYVFFWSSFFLRRVYHKLKVKG